MEWSISKLSALRQCHRKFYFAYELKDFHFTHPIRRKAHELSQSKNLRMWQGSLIDEYFSKTIISLYQKKQVPDFNKLADELVSIAKRQFEFSSKQLYHDRSLTKKSAGDAYQILDIHEWNVPYKEEDLLRVYSTIKEIIQQIPTYNSPEEGKNLHEYLTESSFLLPNVQGWSFMFDNVKLNPQIDFIRYKGDQIHVIDWKVSESDVSDYSKQLYLAGIVAFHNIKKSAISKGKNPPGMENVSLYEINLMNGNVKPHPFTKETTAGALDYVYMHSAEQEQLSGDKEWHELNIEDYETTDKKETCAFCKFKPLCIHLIKNNYRYDEAEYYKLVQNHQLA
jgi:hypothetical protein